MVGFLQPTFPGLVQWPAVPGIQDRALDQFRARFAALMRSLEGGQTRYYICQYKDLQDYP
jgi:hypothetical protein